VNIGERGVHPRLAPGLEHQRLAGAEQRVLLAAGQRYLGIERIGEPHVAVRRAHLGQAHAVLEGRVLVDDQHAHEARVLERRAIDADHAVLVGAQPEHGRGPVREEPKRRRQLRGEWAGGLHRTLGRRVRARRSGGRWSEPSGGRGDLHLARRLANGPRPQQEPRPRQQVARVLRGVSTLEHVSRLVADVAAREVRRGHGSAIQHGRRSVAGAHDRLQRVRCRHEARAEDVHTRARRHATDEQHDRVLLHPPFAHHEGPACVALEDARGRRREAPARGARRHADVHAHAGGAHGQTMISGR
jgi:hypothetical protein